MKFTAESFTKSDGSRHGAILRVPGEWARPIANILLDRRIEAVLTQEIADFGPDVVHAHTELVAPAAVKVAARHGLPVVVTIHGQNTNKRYLESSLQAERFRKALSGADRLVVVGESLRAYTARIAGRDDHIVVVWNGVDPPPEEYRAPTNVEPIELICVANLQEGKGVDLLIDALAQLKPGHQPCVPEWRLTVIGDGPLRKELQRRSEELGLRSRVAFAGSMSNAKVFDHLKRADIFALPSYREAFGIAYLEAMASGLLTIGVEGQGPSQFIEHGRTGLLVKPRNVDSLLVTLRDVLSDPQRSWRSIAVAGAAFVRKEVTWSAHADALLDTFRSITLSRVSIIRAVGSDGP